ncbi:hypothetical protein MK131_07470 [Candidatus Poribacteria bacterium]|nr:hypothetical protein [Candidatus Poribacteria bacterium]
MYSTTELGDNCYADKPDSLFFDILVTNGTIDYQHLSKDGPENQTDVILLKVPIFIL